MSAVRGRVVKGKVVTRARLLKGERVVVRREDDDPPVNLDPHEEAGVLKGIREFSEGKTHPVSRLRAKLRRHLS